MLKLNHILVSSIGQGNPGIENMLTYWIEGDWYWNSTGLYSRPFTSWYRGHPCLGLAAIFAGMLYNVQIIQKSSTRNIMHVSIIVLELPAKLQWVID